MDKAYDHSKEEAIYEKWEKSGAFTPKRVKGKKPYTIIMPPPNANDPLHIGHARFVTISDVLARYHRMTGKDVLWLPGSDHAGIETQYVFEKKLKEKGKSRFDYDRDTLYKMIWDYVKENTGTMERQLKRLGASADWTRFKFTLDPDIVAIVLKTFKRLYSEGYVYRGERIVNYCPRCGTNFSELEVNHIEREDNMYYLNYGPIAVATTRPETIFADVALAVNPKDSRYKKLIGKSAKIPLINREIPIIADKLVDKDFGTGVLKITPGHSADDFEIGQRHNLSTISVIDENGRMTGTPQKYIGMKAEHAREEVARDLEEAGAIKKTEKIIHTVGVCYRDKGLIEPMVAKQWFIKMDHFAKQALGAIKNKKVKIVPRKQEKIANHWLRNIRDWNISRQIVWGIRIPAFRCDKCLEWTVTDGETPEKCSSCGHGKLIQDPDTFDTWFSSGQWPYATLMSTKKGDFEHFYPTSVMVTAYEILFFWVLRMVMFGLYTTDETPFKDVLLYGLVRDKEGLKISKSKGNVIDPIEMTTKYGADALRMGLIWGALIDNDISLSEENIRGQRNFGNKLWNVSRFILMNKSEGLSTNMKRPRTTNAGDKEILSELSKTQKNIAKLIEKYRLNEAAEELYNFVWYKLANNYLEKTKERREDAQKTLEYVLVRTLVMAHPFMPYVTESIWGQIEKSELLINTSWD
jgi:valyl-tRNA synthetase